MTRATHPGDIDAALDAESFFADPYTTYARLREEDPVHWCEPWGQWVVTRFDDVLAVNKDPKRFSSAGWERKFIAQLPPELQGLPHMQRHYGTKVLSMTDPPEHTRLRRLVVRSFTPRVLEALRPAIEQLVDELLDEAERGGTSMDAISQFAYPLPAIVIAKLLGAPEDGRERFVRWSKTIVDFVGTGHPDTERARNNEQTLEEFREFLEPIIVDRRRDPQPDLISILASSDDGERLTDDEIVSTCIVLLFAGHETTANLLGNGLLALLRHPDQLDLLRAEPDRMPAAVEELLRYDSPVQRNRRLATQDLTFGGKQIRQGDSVLVFMGSANRDAAKFEAPDSLDIRRAPNAQMSFGYGIHFCAGAALTRLEAPIALRALLQRYPAIRLADDFSERWHRNITFRGLESLEVVID